MTRSKLTPEDVEWLEQRIRASVAPIAPRPSFVLDAKQALLSEASNAAGAGEACDRPPGLGIAYGMVFLSAALILTALVRRRMGERLGQ